MLKVIFLKKSKLVGDQIISCFDNVFNINKNRIKRNWKKYLTVDKSPRAGIIMREKVSYSNVTQILGPPCYTFVSQPFQSFSKGLMLNERTTTDICAMKQTFYYIHCSNLKVKK